MDWLVSTFFGAFFSVSLGCVEGGLDLMEGQDFDDTGTRLCDSGGERI